MTAKEILNLGFALAGENFEECSFKPIVLNWLNIALAISLPFENNIRQADNLPNLQQSPIITAQEQVIEFAPQICKVALPYFICASIYDDRQIYANGQLFYTRFLQALQNSGKGIECKIIDWYREDI